jgi:hypothetical protein
MDHVNAMGTIPRGIGLFSSLERLEFSGGPIEFIKGTLPTELGLLTAMKQFKADNNELVGSVHVPTELGR